MQFVNSRDGSNLYLYDWGRGPPVVFLAGRAQTADMWQYQMEPMLRAGVRCIAYDRRGHGRSSKPGHGYDYDTLADDLAALLDTLDLRHATLVGHSMGGGEIVRYLSRHGSGRVSRIVLVSAPMPLMLKTQDNPDGVAEADMAAVRSAIAADFPKWCADISGPYFIEGTSPQMKQWSADMALATPLPAMLALDRTYCEADFRSELPQVRLPALVIHGGKDIFVPPDLTARRTAKLIPKARLEIYEDAPHGLPLTHADRLANDLLAFVRT